METIKKVEYEYSLRDELDSAWAARPLALPAPSPERPSPFPHAPGGYRGFANLELFWQVNRDPALTRYLEGFGRYGIPFDAVYGPGRPAGEALPELLSADTVLQALDRAAVKPAPGASADRADR